MKNTSVAKLVSNDWARVALLTSTAMLAFAGNSILCRVALRTTALDPASFTAVRIGAGALTLWFVAPKYSVHHDGSWASAVALFVYAAAFSFAYVGLPTGVGALVLFGAVQLTMIAWGFWRGERMKATEVVGTLAAVGGLMMLLFPGTSTGGVQPSRVALMLSAGVAWGIYSLAGRRMANPVAATRANFIRAVPLAGALLLAFRPEHSPFLGIALGAASGAITSAAGYIIWYSVLPRVKATQAATVQLCVPAVAALLGFVVLGERLSILQWLSAASVLAGVSLTMRR